MTKIDMQIDENMNVIAKKIAETFGAAIREKVVNMVILASEECSS